MPYVCWRIFDEGKINVAPEVMKHIVINVSYMKSGEMNTLYLELFNIEAVYNYSSQWCMYNLQRGGGGRSGTVGGRSPGASFGFLPKRSIPKPDQHRKDSIQRELLGTNMLQELMNSIYTRCHNQPTKFSRGLWHLATLNGPVIAGKCLIIRVRCINL